jgi:hypothetical protein
MKLAMSIVAAALAAIALSLASGALRAQPTPAVATAVPPTIAVLSLVGDEFSMIQHRVATGSRLDSNDKRVFPIPDAIFDDAALDAAERAIKQTRPLAAVLRFSIRDPRLFKLQDRVLADAPDAREVREALLKLLRENQATQLILITKRRDDAAFKLADGSTGIGKIAGLGFYVDATRPIRNVESGEFSNGYFAAYAYMDVTLVDVASLIVARSVPVRASALTVDTAKSETFRAWDRMTGQQKLDALVAQIRNGVSTAVPRALAD